MEQLHKSELSKQQKVKVLILKQERYSSIIIFIIFLVFGIFGGISLFATSWGISWFLMKNYINTVVLCLLFICFVVMLRVCRRAIRRQKEKWMSNYGEQVIAVVTRTDSIFAQHFIYLEWCHPQTGKIYLYKIIVPRSKLKLAYRYEAGSQIPLWIDPDDPDFYILAHNIGFIEMPFRNSFSSQR